MAGGRRRGAEPSAGAGAPGAAATPGDMAGRATIYVVSTPIGNLGDVTIRALDVLRSVPLVAAEDTRVTRRLFARYGIGTPLVSYHARNADRREPELLAHLEAGRDLALVTDAGTPLVSDPGEGLVRAWVSRGGRIAAVPGASAVLAALAAGGVAAARWSFEGFLPRSGRERRDRLARIAADERATVLYEAPGRTAATLRDLARACAADRRGALCRELTKLHEDVRRGSLGELAMGATAEPPRGEVVLVVEGTRRRGAGARRGGEPGAPEGGVGEVASEARSRGAGPAAGPASQEAPSLDAARERVGALVDAGLTRSAAARKVAIETGHLRRVLFRGG